MSRDLLRLDNLKQAGRELAVTAYHGGELGPCVQLTITDYGRGAAAYVGLTVIEASRVRDVLDKWIEGKS